MRSGGEERTLKAFKAKFLDAPSKRGIKAAKAVIRLMGANHIMGYA